MTNTEILTIYGYNIGFRIDSGKLKIKYGFPAFNDVKESVVERGTNNIEHIVILSQCGYLSIDVINWLMNQNIAVTLLDEYGNILTSFMPESHISPIVKRRQATASNELNKTISTQILSEKLQEQRKVLSYIQTAYQQAYWLHPERKYRIEQAISISTERERMLSKINIDSQMILEAQAAAAYWNCFEGIPLLWKQAVRIPQNWLTLGNRTSPKSGSPRKAVDPFNAGLNYCYAVLETMVKQNCLLTGIDPDFGIIHADHSNRASLVFDLMESLRPRVDKILFNWYQSTKFNPKDFFETREGICKVGVELTKQIIPLVKGLQTDVSLVVKNFASYFKNKAINQKPKAFEEIENVKNLKTKQTKPLQITFTELLPIKETVKPIPIKDKACLECGVIFTSKKSNQKFCCERHKDTYRKRSLRQKRKDAGLCPQCGKYMPEAAAGTYKEKLTYCGECREYWKEKYTK